MEKIAFLFPGQGSQYVGMGRGLYNLFSVARETFEEADEALQFKISKLCFEGPWEDLKLTINTQPAILTVSVSALRVLQSEIGLSASLLAGHSLGEYSALVAGGAIEFTDAVQVVRARGQFIQEAVPLEKGAVGVVLGLDEAAVKSICQEAAQGEIITPANYNCSGQIAISGHRGAVRRAVSLANKRGAKGAVLLPVSAPMHSPLMESAGKRLGEALSGVPIMDRSCSGRFQCGCPTSYIRGKDQGASDPACKRSCAMGGIDTNHAFTVYSKVYRGWAWKGSFRTIQMDKWGRCSC